MTSAADLSAIAAREGEEWGVALLSPAGGRSWLSIAEAHSLAERIRSAARLAARPGELPQEDHG